MDTFDWVYYFILSTCRDRCSRTIQISLFLCQLSLLRFQRTEVSLHCSFRELSSSDLGILLLRTLDLTIDAWLVEESDRVSRSEVVLLRICRSFDSVECGLESII